MFNMKTFRSSLVLNFLLATILPLVCLGYFSYSYMSFTINESSKRSNELLAETVANEISAQLSFPAIELRQVGVLLRSLKSTSPGIDSMLDQTVFESSYLESIYIIDEKKRITHSRFTQIFE